MAKQFLLDFNIMQGQGIILASALIDVKEEV
jgi:hypothetical protein